MDNRNPIRRCPYCKQEIDPEATACPHCHQTFISDSPLKNLILSVIGFFFLYYLISTFVSCEAERETKKLFRQAEKETERLYRQMEQETERLQQKYRYHIRTR